ESTENNMLPLTFSEQFLWNRDFALRWDLTRNLHMNFQSATHAEIEEPYTPVNKDLYPDRYEAWKDSVWTSIKHFGTPLDYQQNFTLSYQLPINLLPIFDWVNADANYTAAYTWVRGTKLEDGTSLGNTITANRSLNVNGSFNLERLYNHVPFLKKTNERFNRTRPVRPKLTDEQKKAEKEKKEKKPKDKDEEKKKALPRNQRSFEKEIVINADSAVLVSHGKKTKRLIVSAKDERGKTLKIKWRKVGDTQVKVFNRTDSAIRMKLTVTPKGPLDNKGWYKTAQCVARALMMVRSASVSYRNQYAMALPGFMPTVGDAFGQTRGMGAMSPGLGFAFGLIDDDYIGKARDNNWLLMNDSVATPATTNQTEDLQIRMTLEPFKDFKIDLTASRMKTTSRSIQYMYAGNPTTLSGSFTMTTLSLGTAFESLGDANNGYHSAAFNRFVQSLDGYRDRVEAQYRNATYPASFGGGHFDSTVGAVNKYSADVMVPAFLNAYTSMDGNGLNIFPALRSLLPNWTIRYSGLSRLPFFEQFFKSVNINHAYRSIFAIGSYQSYSTWQKYMNGLGFIADATTGNPIPSSMYNISQVSINEAFSPLLGIDLTLQNNLTARLEYRQTRVLSLSMTSVQLNEASSKDWVVGVGYRINDFNLFNNGTRHVARKKKKNMGISQQDNSSSRQDNGLNHDLNLRLDMSYRRQASLTRDIASLASSASSGNTAFKFAFMGDYTLSRLVTASLYYDLQINTPLLSSGSYPTTTHDFGVSLRLSLTR
ncbi:MAG: cell surface protein SprA, partial [Prevotella denticola]